MFDKKQAVHAVRVGIVVCIALLIRAEQKSTPDSTTAPDIELQLVTAFFPNASSLEPSSDGRVEVLDANGTPLGYVLQTAPYSNHIIGFSGPTNILIGVSGADEIIGSHVVSSGDTRDHVRQIVRNEGFMTALHSLPTEQAAEAQYDAVSGATLTSLAIRESTAFRLGNREMGSLRFPDPPALVNVAKLFPDAHELKSIKGSSLFEVFDSRSEKIGEVLRTSPAADNTIGFQGPTDALIGFSLQRKVIGIAVGKTFDNEPYATYVRDDAYFLSTFNDLDLVGVADFDLMKNQVEGVSGATMTSMSVADGVVLAATKHWQQLALSEEREAPSFWSQLSIHDMGTVLVVLLGMLIGLTRLRANKWIGFAWKLVLIGYLGFIAASLVSQAMLVGWAGHGVPVQSAFGLVVLSVAAFSIPTFTRRNLYCTHLCPHGAAQQLLRRKIGWQWRIPPRLKIGLRMIPALLLLWCVIVGMSRLSFSLVDIEPFDAYVFRIAGWATCAVAVVGLLFSLFVPMGYCRYGCPTGALLEFFRFHAKSDCWSLRDWLATICLLVAICLRWL